MSITSYFFPINPKGKGRDKKPSNGPAESSGNVKSNSGTIESKIKPRPRPTPYPNASSRKSSLNVLETEPSSSTISRSSTLSLSGLVPATSSGDLEYSSTLNNLVSDTSNPDTTSFSAGDHPRWANLKRIADDTIEAIEKGFFELNGTTFDFSVAVKEMTDATEYWGPDASRMVNWAQETTRAKHKGVEISVLEISTLQGARVLETQCLSSTAAPNSRLPKIGILNFASATKPGGGFLSGASAQEESIARSSTLYYSLTTRNAEEFYKIHKRLKGWGSGRKSNGRGKGRGEGAGRGGRGKGKTGFESNKRNEHDTQGNGGKKGRWGYRGKAVVWIPDSGPSQEQELTESSSPKDQQEEDGEETERETESEKEEEEAARMKRDSSFYTHSMIYSPSVLLFRDDAGSWLKPLAVDVVTSAAVNAGDVRTKYRSKTMTKSEQDALEKRIEGQMRERMARILHLFSIKGVRNIVLGSFGTGVFRNNVDMVAGLWRELLVGTKRAPTPFRNCFDRVVFAVLGRQTFETFERVLGVRDTSVHAAVSPSGAEGHPSDDEMKTD